ncbi:hypothetical protein N9091_00055 [bacterium]|nr:hypothetical protein [bacterium]
MPDSTKKFSQLDSITTLDSNDIFAVTDVDQTKSMKISTANLSNVILSDDNINSKASIIRNKLNAISASSGNGLYAQNLWYNGEYRNGAYLQNYENISGTPVLVTDLSQLNNTSEYVKYSGGEAPQMVVSGGGATDRTMTTNFLPEGSNNQYYTDPKVLSVLDANFGRLFNNYSDTFDGGGLGDSLIDVAGLFTNATSYQSSTIRVADGDKIIRQSFIKGQIVRLYGAALSESNLSSVPNAASNLTVSTQGGFTNATGTNSRNFSYKIAFYNMGTGEVSQASSAISVDVYFGGNVVYDETSSAFNTDNFVKLDLTGYAVGQGVLIYRKLVADTNWKLVAVLGDKELPSWNDYHTFDHVAWSGKSSTDNSFTAVTHFPLTAPTGPARGWVDSTIQSITESEAYIDITLTSTLYTNTNYVVQIAHNDTSLINEAITQKSIAGRRSLSLNAKVYNATHIDIVNDFGLIGVANVTKIKKLPWSGFKGTNGDNSLIKSTQSTNAQNISFVGVDFDGNLANQFLLNDTTDTTLNYLINLGSNPTAVTIDRTRLKNTIGGGIYATSPNEFKMTASEIVNSGVTDRFEFSPLIVDNGNTTIITGNRFENFTDHIDASITSEGAIANNIIKACGSGLFVYGSTFLLSSPNVLMGAANEFLSSPDILNSDYDSINIYLSSLEDTPPWTSDRMVYQENGSAFDLSQSSTAFSSSIIYRLNMIQQLSDGTSVIYGDKVGPGALGIDGNAHNTFIIGKRYRIAVPGDVVWTNYGATNTLAGTEFIYTESGGDTTPAGTTGYATSSEFAGYSTNAPIVWTDVPGSNENITRSLGQFQFQIQSLAYDQLKTGIYSPASLQSLYAANTKTSVADGTRIHPFGSSHVGVAWSASYRYDAQVATITGSGAWSSELVNTDNAAYTASKTHPVYTVNITQIQNRPIAVGNYVRIDGHTGFAMHTGSTGALGLVVHVGVDVDTISIKYWTQGDSTAGADAGGNAAGCTQGTANVGTINIVDDFVMAQGLIK